MRTFAEHRVFWCSEKCQMSYLNCRPCLATALLVSRDLADMMGAAFCSHCAWQAISPNQRIRDAATSFGSKSAPKEER